MVLISVRYAFVMIGVFLDRFMGRPQLAVISWSISLVLFLLTWRGKISELFIILLIILNIVLRKRENDN